MCKCNLSYFCLIFSSPPPLPSLSPPPSHSLSSLSLSSPPLPSSPQLWLKCSEDPSWEQLSSALASSGLPELAKRVRDKYCSSSRPPSSSLSSTTSSTTSNGANTDKVVSGQSLMSSDMGAFLLVPKNPQYTYCTCIGVE